MKKKKKLFASSHGVRRSPAYSAAGAPRDKSGDFHRGNPQLDGFHGKFQHKMDENWDKLGSMDWKCACKHALQCQHFFLISPRKIWWFCLFIPKKNWSLFLWQWHLAMRNPDVTNRLSTFIYKHWRLFPLPGWFTVHPRYGLRWKLGSLWITPLWMMI